MNSGAMRGFIAQRPLERRVSRLPTKTGRNEDMNMAKTMIDKMVDRFLSWPLPENFEPDCGIKFTPFHPNGNTRYEPSGTNLLSAMQARAMIVHMLPGTLLEWAAATEEEGEAYMHGYYDGEAAAKTANDRVEGRDAALSRRVPSHDGLAGKT